MIATTDKLQCRVRRGGKKVKIASSESRGRGVVTILLDSQYGVPHTYRRHARGG